MQYQGSACMGGFVLVYSVMRYYIRQISSFPTKSYKSKWCFPPPKKKVSPIDSHPRDSEQVITSQG